MSLASQRGKRARRRHVLEPHAPTRRQICPPDHAAGLQELDVEPLIRNGNRRRSHLLKITPQTRPILPEPRQSTHREPAVTRRRHSAGTFNNRGDRLPG
jgi:hypothetical protein